MRDVVRRLLSWRVLAASGALALLSLVGCGSLDAKQREWIFQPSDRTWWGGLAAAEGMQDVWIEHARTPGAEPVKLHALWAPQAHADAPVLLYLHGARYDVRGSAHRMRRLQQLGFSVLGVDYRGFGQSTRVLPSETFAYEDARAAWDWLARRYPQRPRYIFGHSLGAAIAVNLATEVNDAKGLIVEGGFTSIPDVVSSFKWGWLPLGPLITQRFNAVDRIGNLRVPLLVVHGSNDTLIAPALGRTLYERAPQPKRFVLVEGGTHHSTNAVGLDQYRTAVAEMFGVSAPQ